LYELTVEGNHESEVTQAVVTENDTTTINLYSIPLLTSLRDESALWIDDSIPGSKQYPMAISDAYATGWIWVSSNPSPVSGNIAHQSAVASGLHGYNFGRTDEALRIVDQKNFVTWMYIDPVNTPREVMFSLSDRTATGEQRWYRFYWGENLINITGSGLTTYYHYMGELPPSGTWYKVSINLKDYHIEGSFINGIDFLSYDGRVTWDATGLE